MSKRNPAASEAETVKSVDPLTDPLTVPTRPEGDPTLENPNLGATGAKGPGELPGDQVRMPNEETPKNPDGTAKIEGVVLQNVGDTDIVIGDPVPGGVEENRIAARPLDTEGRMPNEETPKTEDGKAKILGGAPAKKPFRVMFNPPTPVGDKARLMEVDASDASDALAQWRAATGFMGETAVLPIVQEIKE